MLNILIVIIFTIVLIKYLNTNETMINIKPLDNHKVNWSRNLTCKYYMDENFKKTLNKFNMKKSNNNWDLYIPCTYNNIKKEADAIKNLDTNQRVFFLKNADEICGKNTLWLHVLNYYGRKKASIMMPLTYVLYLNHDIELFKKEYTVNNIYIIKKNIQQQKGLHITNDKNNIINGFKKGYVIAQLLLQDPFIINGRKINMRFYLLIIIYNSEIAAYVHDNGFMYYTKDKFIKRNTQIGPNITTGYIDRKVYDVNPLTHHDFRKYLDDGNRKMTIKEYELFKNNIKISNYVFDKIYNLLSDMVQATKNVLIKNNNFKNTYQFQLFGVDISLSNKLEPMIIEINKGPDLNSKDDRDSQVKLKVIEDMLKTLKLVPDNNNAFIPIY